MNSALQYQFNSLYSVNRPFLDPRFHLIDLCHAPGISLVSGAERWARRSALKTRAPMPDLT